MQALTEEQRVDGRRPYDLRPLSFQVPSHLVDLGPWTCGVYVPR